MNEKIKELAEQAEKYANEQAHRAWHHSSGFNPFKEKFAELIVKECANLLDPDGEYTEKYKNSHTPGPDGLRQVLSHERFHEMMAANKLKKHFGVEE